MFTEIALAYSLSGQDEKALPLLKLSLTYIKPDEDSIQLCNVYSALGLTYLNLKKYYPALKYYRKYSQLNPTITEAEKTVLLICKQKLNYKILQIAEYTGVGIFVIYFIIKYITPEYYNTSILFVFGFGGWFVILLSYIFKRYIQKKHSTIKFT
jgi:tetratricopeptide (TPR) repeat protein